MKKSLSKPSKKSVKRLKLDSSFLKIGPAAKTLGVSIDTLRRWEKSGKITAERTPGGTRLYHLSTLKKINPVSVEDFQTKGQTTEELLNRIQKDSEGLREPADQSIRESDIPEFRDTDFSGTPSLSEIKKASLINHFLIGSTILSVITLLLTTWITVSYFTSKNEPQPPVLVTQQPNNNSAVLAETASPNFLEINSNAQINGLLSVRDSINNLSLEGTPSASTMTLSSGDTTLTVSNDATLDQDVSTTSTPSFNTLNLSSTSNQLVLQSGGPTGTLTWTPTAARTITLPDATDTLVGKATTDTLTNKSISGSSNTLTNIPNSALSNSKVTVTAGTNLTGGGDITLGSSATIALKDSPSISGSFTIAGVVSLADGTAAAPALTFTSDTNTGLYRIGTDKIGLITGGSATSGITIDSSGNVGVGTITPSYQLETTGNVGVGKSLTVTSAGIFSSTGTFASTLTASNGLTLTTGALSLTSTSGQANLALTPNTNAFTVNGLFGIDTTNNRVGIGTTNPQVALQVLGGNVGIGTSAAGSTLAVNGNGVIGWGTASVAGPTDGLGISGNLGIGTTTPNNKLQVIGAGVFGADYGQYSAAINGLLVQGNVGIGATTSNNKLDVWGNSRLAGTLTVDSTSSFGGNLTLNSGQFLAPNGTSSLPSYSFTNSTSTGMYSPSSNALALNTNGASTPPLTITAAGSVGIGVTAPTQLFQVNATGSNSIVITSAGNVGIGTTSPAANLHVTGTSKFDGISTHGNVLPETDITYDLGSAAVRWNNAYVYTLTATNIAGVVTGGSTTSSDWMINANNTLDSANSTLTFKRGSPTNAVLQWYGNNNTFDFNSGLRIGMNNGSASTIENTTGLVLSGFANDITTATNEHLSLIPNGTGNVGIGTSSPGALLGVLGGVNIGGGSSRFAEKAGPANGLAVEGNVGIGTTTASSNLTVVGNAMISQTWSGISVPTSGLFVEGSVGIGATTSSNKLDVWGNTRLAGTLAVDSTSSFGGNLTLSSGQFLAPNGTASLPSHSFTNLTNAGLWTNGDGLLLTTGGTNTSGITVTGAGNVGIGTTSPDMKFTVNGDMNIANGNGFILGHTAQITSADHGGVTSSIPQFQMLSTSRGGSTLMLGSFSTGDTYNNAPGPGLTLFKSKSGTIGTPGALASGDFLGEILWKGDDGTDFKSNAASIYAEVDGTPGTGDMPGRLVFATTADGAEQPSERMRITSAGNVGIGTSAAGAALQVNGGGLFGWGTASVAGPANGLAVSGNVGIGTTSFTSGLSGLQIQPAARSKTALLVTDSDGSSSFEINLGSGGQSTIYQRDAEGVIVNVFGTGGASYITGGNVGIGTASPGSALTVIGNVGIGTSAAGAALQVNGGGLFGWGTASVTAPSNGLAVSGNVGIGTTTATHNLEVIGTANFTGNVGVGNSLTTTGLTVANGGLNVTGLANLTGNVGIGSSLTVTSAGVFSGGLMVNGGSVVLPTGSIQNSELENSSITVNATAGTGLSVSGSPVSLGGTLTIAGIDASTTVKGVASFNSTNFSVSSGAVNTIQDIATSATPTFVGLNTTSGNVGIGTSSTGARLAVNGGGLFGWGTASVAGPSNGLAVSGNVGIGTTTPLAPLHVWGNNTNSALFLNGNVGIGTISPTSGLNIYGTSQAASQLTIQRFDGAARSIILTPASSSLYASVTTSSTQGLLFNTAGYQELYLNGSGNVGIGTTGPSSKLTVDGDLEFVGVQTIKTSSGNLILDATDDLSLTGRDITITTDATKVISFQAGANFNFQDVDDSNATRVVIESSSGNVGIGFTSPNVVLQVASAPSSASSLANILGANGSQLSLTGSTATTLQSKLALGIDTTNNFGYIQAGNIAGTATAYNLALEPNGGNVGIGTSAPSYPLDVLGNTSIPGSGYTIPARIMGPSSNGNAFPFVEATSTAYWWLRTTSNAHSWMIGAESDGTDSVFEIARVTNGGGLVSELGSRSRSFIIDYTSQNLGIGLDWATLPAAKLQVAGNAMIGYASGTPGSLSNGLAVSGNVGIGTTSPTVTLEAVCTNNCDWQFTRSGSGVLRGSAGSTPAFGTNSAHSLSIKTNWTDAMVIDTSQNIGIGMSAPDRLLHIAGTIDITPTNAGLMGVSGTQFDISGATTNAAKKLVLGIDTTDNYGIIQAGNTSGTNYALSLNPAGGNVGIGNTSPGALLDIGWDGTTEGKIILRTTGVETAPSVAASAGNLILTTPTGWVTLTPDNGIQVTGNSSAIWWTANNGNVLFDLYKGSTATALTINNTGGGAGATASLSVPNGNVGIGTSARGASLAINGNSVIGWGTAAVAGPSNGLAVSGNVGIGTTSPGALLDVGLAGTTLGTIRLAGNTSGNVTIQTAAAAGTWSLTLPTTDGDANQFLQTNGSGVTTWAVAGLPSGTSGQTLRHDGADWVANSLLFNNGTNVGIGMSAPDRLLHIAGTIDITSTNAGLMGVSGTQFDISGATTNAAKKLVLGIDTTDNYGIIQAGNTSGTNYALSLNPAGGNVGIGTTSPSEKLHITGGNVRIDGKPAVDSTTWTDVEDTIVGALRSLAVYNGQLYAGDSSGNIYRYEGGTTWTDIATLTHIRSLAVYNGKLYAADDTGSSTNIYRYDGGTTWTDVMGSPTTIPGTARSLTVYNGQLYIGDSNGSSTNIYRYDGVTTWTDVYTGTLGGGVNALVVYNGQLYVGGDGPVFLRYDGGTTWTSLVGSTCSSSNIKALAVYNGQLYAGCSAGDVYRHEGGSTWTDIASFSANGVFSLAVYNGQLYAGDWAGNIYRYDGDTTWTDVATINTVEALAVYNGQLYAGDGGGDVYQYTANPIQSYALKFQSDAEIASMWFQSSSSGQGNESQNQHGQFIFSHGILTNSGAYDIAEEFPTSDLTLEPGDIISSSLSSPGFIERSSRSYQSDILGVISTKPGFTLSGDDKTSANKLVALAGRVPVKVSLENGPIQVGDYLTSSSIPGVAMKATKAGPTVGKALESFGGDCFVADAPRNDVIANEVKQSCQGKVMAFVNVSWYDPDALRNNLSDISINLLDGASFNLAPSKLYTVSSTLSGAIGRVGAFDQLALGSLTAGNISTDSLNVNHITVQGQDLLTTITSKVGLDSFKVSTASSSASLAAGEIAFTDNGQILGVSTNDKPPNNILLSGKTSVKVSTENGPIQVGDFLTSSATSGVAMKATRPGTVVGKALESYDNPDPHQVGTILIFVNVTFADPGNFLASLSLDEEGNMIIPKIRTSSLLLGPISQIGQIGTDGTQITTNSDPNYTSPGPNLASNTNSYIDLSGKIASLENRVIALQTESSKQAARIKNLQDILGNVGIGTTSAVIASDSAAISTSSAEIASSSATPRNDNDGLNLTPPDILLNTGSAVFTNLTVKSEATMSGQLSSYDLTISNTLKSLGQTTLADTLIAGDLTIDGTLSISRNSINAIGLMDSGILYLQKSLLAQGLDIFNGKITIDPAGNITTQGKIIASEVQTNKLTISNTPIASSSATLATSIGTATLPANSTAVTIQTSQAYDSAKVFITPTSPTDKILSVANINPGVSFDVSVLTPSQTDINFNWWIVQTN